MFDAFPVETVYVSGDPNSTLTYNAFLRGVRDEGAKTEVLRAGMLMDWGGVRADVIGPPTDLEGGLFSEINDNSVAILLTYGTARILLAGDAEANEEEYMANGPYTGPADDPEGHPPRLEHLIDPPLPQPLSTQGCRHPMRRG